MKDFIVNIVAKYLGVNKALEWADGHKTYLAGAGLMLMGAAEILLDAVPAIATKNPAAIAAFAASVPSNPGTAKFLEGLAVTGLRHAFAKKAATLPAPEAAK